MKTLSRWINIIILSRWPRLATPALSKNWYQYTFIRWWNRVPGARDTRYHGLSLSLLVLKSIRGSLFVSVASLLV